MNKPRAIIKWLRWFLVEWSHWIMAAVGAAAFVGPILTSPTETNPTADAGLFAPVIALCTASIVFAQAVNPGGLIIRRTPGILIGVGSLLSAYLWMAAEADAHPADPALPIVLLILFSAAAVGILAIAFLTPGHNPHSNDHSSIEDAGISVNTGTQAIYEEILKVAKRKSTVYYSDVAPLAGLDLDLLVHRIRIAQILDGISTSEHEAERPLLSAVVVGKGTGRPGKGFFDLARRLVAQHPSNEG